MKEILYRGSSVQDVAGGGKESERGREYRRVLERIRRQK